MTPESLMDLFRQAIMLAIVLCSVIIIPGLIVGLCISIFQAATQINEQTLSFVPRLLVTFASMMFFGPWLLNQLISFTDVVIDSLPLYLH